MKFKILALGLMTFSAYSQNTLSYSSIESHYNHGVELFERKAYSSARSEFKNYITLSEKSVNPNKFNLANAEYYSAMSSLYSKAKDADIEVERFVLNHSDHPKAKMIFADLAENYFERKDYKEAIKYYEKSLENRADNLDTYEIRYRLGLAYFQQKDYNNALRQFNYVKGTVIENAVNAAYYAATINFQNGNYDQALPDLRRIENIPQFKKEIPNWIGQILYRQKKYSELLAYAEPILANPDGRKVDELALLAAEVSFFDSKYDKAAVYYDRFRSLNKTTKLSNQVIFRNAFSLYKTEKYDKAATLFKNIAANKDELGQQAAYYLGICALQQGDLNSALVAFENAKKLDFDKDIKEEAEYNYLKVLVEQGNNQSAITGLQAYIQNYPNGKYTNEINEFLSDILFETKNYAQALTYIEGLPRTTPKINEAYQKLAFGQGVIEFNAEKYQDAIRYFDKSLSKNLNSNLGDQAKYWKAEAYFHLKDPKAEGIYRELQSSSDRTIRLKSQYSLGYIKFNEEKFSESLRFFQDFKSGAASDQSMANLMDDANLRIADSYLGLKNMNQSLTAYDEAYRNNKTGRDYALYQKAMVLKFLGREAEAKSNLDQFTRLFGNSRLANDALYQSGSLAMESGNYSSAINTFTNILKNNPNSELVPDVLLKRAIAYSNIGNYNSSISDYKLILNKYGKSDAANEAFLGIREVLSQANRSEEFFEIAEIYKKNNPQNTSVQGLQFESAKDLFFNEKYDKAITAFTQFIDQNPGSVLIPEANYLLAESYAASNNLQMALRYYQIIVMGNQIEYLSQAAMRSAVIYANMKNYEEAIQNYLQVTYATSNQRELIVAYEGLMKSYFETGNYEKTAEYADKILTAGGNVVIGASNRAELYKGKALMKKGDLSNAKIQFEKTIKLANDEAAAESKYRIGEIQYIQKDYDASIKTMQELAGNYSGYLTWYEKAFLMIADNYIAKNDKFMAKATLNSIVENSSNPETISEAKRKLSQLN